LAVAALGTGVALAAASPTVVTRSATPVTDFTAVLRASINPNGSETGYAFQYGPTDSYGYTTISHAAGHGKDPVLVAQAVRGLEPGTTYHYRVDALSKAGTSFGGDRAFTTTGHPPASAITGPPVDVGKNSVTVTGSVDPEGEATTWAVQYGLSDSYNLQTIVGLPLAAVDAPLPVSAQLTGLAPGTLFHYRIVAAHGVVGSDGADQTFFTDPSHKRTPRMTTRTSPSRVSHKPYQFTTSGTLHGPGFVPATLRCTGTVKIHYYDGSRQVNSAAASVEPNCNFSTPVPFNHLVDGHTASLRVVIDYGGNGFMKSVSRTDYVTLG
jgi:hypothetical protein